MLATVLSLMLSVPETPRDVRFLGSSAAQMWCNRQTAENGRTCKVQSVLFSAKEDLYVMGATAFLILAGDPAVLTLRYRAGIWYVEDVMIQYKDN